MQQSSKLAIEHGSYAISIPWSVLRVGHSPRIPLVSQSTSTNIMKNFTATSTSLPSTVVHTSTALVKLRKVGLQAQYYLPLDNPAAQSGSHHFSHRSLCTEKQKQKQKQKPLIHLKARTSTCCLNIELAAVPFIALESCCPFISLRAGSHYCPMMGKKGEAAQGFSILPCPSSFCLLRLPQNLCSMGKGILDSWRDFSGVADHKRSYLVCSPSQLDSSPSASPSIASVEQGLE